MRLRAPRPPDTRAALFAAAAAGLLIAQQVAGRAARNAFFLTYFEVTALPRVVIVSSLLSILAALAVSRLLLRFGPARVVPAAMAVSALFFFAEWSLAARFAPFVALAVYFHMAVSGSVLISSFWSLVNERFDPHMGKQLIGRIATGATVGGILGGLCAERVGAAASVAMLLPLMAAMNLLSLPALFGFVRGADPSSAGGLAAEDVPSGFSVLRESGYFQRLALLIGLGAVTGAVLNYVLQAEAKAVLVEGEDLLRFFALFFTGVAVLSFLCQALLSERALGRLGLGGTVALLPAATALGASFGAVAPSLLSVVLLCGVEAVLTNSLFRSGYELLYNPLPPERKRATKSLIDVGFDQAGRALGSGLVLLLLAVSGPAVLDHASPLRVLLVASASLSLLGFLVAARIQPAYVAALADSLKARAVAADSLPLVDLATERTVAETSVALRRDDVLRAIAEARGEGAIASGASHVDLVQDLESGDPVRIKRACSRADPRDPRLVAHAVPLLARDDVVPEVLRFLRRAAPLNVGQLIDALLDPQREAAVRRRIPAVLRSCRSQRAADGLMVGLRDRRFEVRYQCARSLARISETSPEVDLPHEEILGAVRREVATGKQVWDSDRPDAAAEGDPTPASLGDVVRRRTDKSLEHVFTLLGMVVDREPLRIAYQALGTDEESLRGTALEYLDNVLPPEIWEAMKPYLGGVGKLPERRRPREQVLEDLLRSNESIAMSFESLQRRLGPKPLEPEEGGE